MEKKIIAIIGSYRKGRIIDTAVSAVLAGAAEQGTRTHKIYLIDKHIEFCSNCRIYAQKKTQGVRAPCIHNDPSDACIVKVGG